MTTTTLTKVGNSMAVLLPKTLREQACLGSDSIVRLASPRKGVVTITAYVDECEDRLSRLESAERRIASRAALNRWPEGMTAEELIKTGKDAQTDGIVSL